MNLPKGKDRIIFPLDFPELSEALSWVDLLKGHVGVFKVGLELFTKYGPKAIEKIKEKTDLPLFLDLKLCDIPNTIAKAVTSVLSLGIVFLTVHTLAGRQALKSAVIASQGQINILAVTLLTSLDKADLLELGFNGEFIRETQELVLRYALVAQRCGCQGIVLSGKEVRRVKDELPQLLTIVPGIRWEDEETNDQLRISTPKEAILSGADYLVVGRPIRQSLDPIQRCLDLKKIIEEAEAAKNA